MTGQRCARYTRDCCRSTAVGSFRRGDFVYHYCAAHELVVRREGTGLPGKRTVR